MSSTKRQLLSGNSTIVLAALHGGVTLGTGYPGTLSTEILECFSQIGGKAQWSPNEKVALEVGIGVAYGNSRALVTMKHVGLNVVADPFFSAAHTGVVGALVVVSADDPGMASSQNEQDNRRYAVAAAVPMLEPSDSQEAYDMTREAIEISERWKIPVLLRVTTRICHTQAPVTPRAAVVPPKPHFEHDLRRRNLIPANARPARRRLRQKLSGMTEWSEITPLNQIIPGDKKLGIITSGVCFMHAREARRTRVFSSLVSRIRCRWKKLRGSSAALNVSITFMKAATTGTLWAEAREISKNFKVGTYTVEIKDDAGDLVAQFQGLAYRKKDKLLI